MSFGLGQHSEEGDGSDLVQELDDWMEKAKYTKRTGTPGNYKYEYAGDATGKRASKHMGSEAKRKAVFKTMMQIESGQGPGGSPAFEEAKKMGYIKRNPNGNTYVTKKGKAAYTQMHNEFVGDKGAGKPDAGLGGKKASGGENKLRASEPKTAKEFIAKYDKMARDIGGQKTFDILGKLQDQASAGRGSEDSKLRAAYTNMRTYVSLKHGSMATERSKEQASEYANVGNISKLIEGGGQKEEKTEKSMTDATHDDQLSKSLYMEKDWEYRYHGHKELYVQALQCMKDKMSLGKEWDDFYKKEKPWSERDEMTRSARDKYRKKRDAERKKIQAKDIALSDRRRVLEEKLIDKKIAQAKLEKSESPTTLEEYLEKAKEKHEYKNLGEMLSQATIDAFHSVDMDVSAEDDEPEDSINRTDEMAARESKEKYVDWYTQKSLDGLEAIDEVLSKSDDASEESTDEVTEETTEKSMTGKEVLEEYLEKSAMPSHDHNELGHDKSATVDGGSADGGELASVGTTSGDNSGKPGPGQDGKGQVTGTKGKGALKDSDKLSEDDAEDEGQMKPHKKPIETVRKSMLPADQRQMVAREHAAAVSQLKKSNDVYIGPDAHPLSHAQLGNTDERVEEMAKSEFYEGGAPLIDKPKAPVDQGVLCKSVSAGGCDNVYSAMLTACPGCGSGETKHRIAPGQMIGGSEGAILEKGRYDPVLRRPQEEPDVYIPGEDPIPRRRG